MKGNDLDLVSSHLTHNILHTFWHFTQYSVIYGFWLNQICNATPQEAILFSSIKSCTTNLQKIIKIMNLHILKSANIL